MKVKVSSLRLHPDNPRFIDTFKYESLKQSLEDFPEMMTARPIIIDSDNIIYSGNMRYRAILDLGWEEVDVLVLPEDMTPEKKEEIMFKANIHSGEWDDEIIEMHFPDFADWAGEQSFDYSMLYDEALDDELDAKTQGVRKSIHVPFDGDAEYLKGLMKDFRDRDIYIGSLYIEHMRNVLRGYETD